MLEQLLCPKARSWLSSLYVCLFGPRRRRVDRMRKAPKDNNTETYARKGLWLDLLEASTTAQSEGMLFRPARAKIPSPEVRCFCDVEGFGYLTEECKRPATMCAVVLHFLSYKLSCSNGKTA